MRTLRLNDSAEIDIALEEWSLDAIEGFEAVAFVHRALDLLAPQKTTIAICEGRRLRVDWGRAWGQGEGARWALVSVPPRASRRALALALSDLALPEARPYVLDVLLSHP